MKKRAVRFTNPLSPYQTGDVASFPVNVAERYVELGRATYLDRQMTPSSEVVIVVPVDVSNDTPAPAPVPVPAGVPPVTGRRRVSRNRVNPANME